MFGNPETTTGGRALKFYSSVRVEVRRMTALKDGEKVIGNRTKIKVVKNKVAAPFREAEVDIFYGEGISRESDLLDLGVVHELVEKSGSWFSYRRRAHRPGPRERPVVSGGESGDAGPAGFRASQKAGLPSRRVRRWLHERRPRAISSPCRRPPKAPESRRPRPRKPAKARFIGFRKVWPQKTEENSVFSRFFSLQAVPHPV